MDSPLNRATSLHSPPTHCFSPSVPKAEVSTVLIVDDSEDNLLLACFVVEQAGYTVLRASSGEEALAQISHQNFHLILLDIMLSDMSGYQVIQHLREQERHHQVPVIAITALASETEKQQMLAAGFTDFLCKPYAIDDLEALLQKYCPLTKRTHMPSLAS